jgi:tripartite-type tricarboxylate transporter receptor subunit TctC
MFAYTSHVVNPSVFAKIPYHPVKDFAPVTLAVGSATVLSVNPSLPARTVKELVALIKANPGKYNIASPGAGATTHLTGEQFRTSLALDLAQVPFNGAGPAIASVIAGHTQIMFSAVASAASQIKAGQLRPLAVTGKTRSAILPEVPTTTEAGYPDIEGDGWVGVLVPAGTPKEIITSLHREMVRIIALPDMKERLPTLGFEPIGNTPEEFEAQIKAEIEKWARIVRDANVKTQ